MTGYSSDCAASCVSICCHHWYWGNAEGEKKSGWPPPSEWQSIKYQKKRARDEILREDKQAEASTKTQNVLEISHFHKNAVADRRSSREPLCHSFKSLMANLLSLSQLFGQWERGRCKRSLFFNTLLEKCLFDFYVRTSSVFDRNNVEMNCIWEEGQFTKLIV